MHEERIQEWRQSSHEDGLRRTPLNPLEERLRSARMPLNLPPYPYLPSKPQAQG